MTEHPPIISSNPGSRDSRGAAVVEPLGTATPGMPQPNALVRWAFWLAIFSLPFSHLYLPGTGGRVGVTRLVQILLIFAVASQPRACLRLVPVALFWFGAYCLARLAAGLWLAPELWRTWWPSTFEWIQFLLPWAWVMFNVLHFPRMGRSGLWALAAGCGLCALFHVVGIGVTEVDQGLEGRSTIFGQNANGIGTLYGVGIVAVAGLGMLKDTTAKARLLALGLTALIGMALAKTGSRTAALTVCMGVAVLLFENRVFIPKARRYAGVLLMVIIMGAVFSQSPAIMQRFGQLEKGNLNQQEGRVRMIPVLWDIFKRSPVYGSGPDNYEFELTRRAMPYLVREQRTISSHNMVLLLLVETGVIGLLLFGTGLGKSLAAAWRARLTPSGVLPLALFLPLALSGLVISNPIHEPIFWLAIAYALAGKL